MSVASCQAGNGPLATGSFILLCLLLAAPVLGQATQKAPVALEARATAAFNRGDYAVALPLLRKLEAELREQPLRLGLVREQIRVCEKNLLRQAAGGASAGEQIPMTPEARKKHPPPQDGVVYALGIKELGNFLYDSEKGGNIPEDVRKLSGTRVRLSGYMIPVDQATNITEFALVPSLLACCFGQPPQVNHTVIVHCPQGKAVRYYPDEILVEGTLKVQEKKEEGYIISLFELDAGSVKPAPK